MHKVFCLLSGGIDSSTTLAMARDQFPTDEIECIGIDYGQRHGVERNYAKIQAENFGASFHTINLQGLMDGMLVDKGDANEAIPEKSYAELDPGISPTYVSFRNGLMLSTVAARAQAWVMEQERNRSMLYAKGGKDDVEATIFLGVHADDGVNWAYPDCTPEFIGPMSAAIFVGTYHKVRVRAPLLYMTKVEVVREGLRLGVDYANTWSCYKGEGLQCGKCPTCLSRREAFELNQATDPTKYAAQE